MNIGKHCALECTVPRSSTDLISKKLMVRTTLYLVSSEVSQIGVVIKKVVFVKIGVSLSLTTTCDVISYCDD